MSALPRRIEVFASGLLTTVQDLGRQGFGAMGVSPSGAADPIALRIGNRLVGNAEGAAALEMTLLGGALRFTQRSIVALAGSDFGATLDGASCPLWESFEVAAGQTLSFGGTTSGARCYLCVNGGIAVSQFLRSASTHLLSGLGGFQGRALRKGDVVELGPAGEPRRPCRANPQLLRRLAPRKRLGATPGPQADWFPASVLEHCFSSTYRVTEQCDRQGLRLEGTSLSPSPPHEMITEGVSLGAIQVPPNGQPIVVFVEQQTTGGYPVIANVISADISSLGQLRPRDQVSFERIDFEAARKALFDQENLLASADLIVES